MSERRFKDRILAFKENDLYVVVSLNFDLVAEAKSMEKAIERLNRSY